MLCHLVEGQCLGALPVTQLLTFFVSHFLRFIMNPSRDWRDLHIILVPNAHELSHIQRTWSWGRNSTVKFLIL